jgi:hypothetical protein
MDLSSRKKGVGEEYTGQIGIHPLVKVRSPREEVSNRIRRAGNVFQGVVEVLEELDPPGLAARDFLWFAEVLEVFVVGTNADRVFSTQKEWAAALKPKDNPKEFFIVGVIVGFHWEEATRVEGNGMKSILVFLGDDDSKSVAGGIGVEDELTAPIGCSQNGMCRATLLQCLESEFTF